MMMGLITIIFLLLLVIGLVVIRYLKGSNRRNRYRRAKSAQQYQKNYYSSPKVSPQLDPISSEKRERVRQQKTKVVVDGTPELEDADEVLGLKGASGSLGEPVITAEEQNSSKPPPLIIFHVMAEVDRPFSGYELLQAMLSVGMRYGDHNIFHRHLDKTGRGPILFSLASSIQPGTFDLSKMGGFSTPGLSLFFSADKVDNPVTVYELMLQTVGQLVDDLGGKVFDEKHELLTSDSVLKQRQLLRHFIEGEQQCSHPSQDSTDVAKDSL